jgi:hypothetical protein
MGRLVCVHVGPKVYCSGSPIRDCSCDRNPDYKDPYPEAPERFADSRDAVEDVTRIIEAWSRRGDTTGLADKLYAISAITRLILTPGVDLSGPFIITSMENGIEEPAKAQ